ncbi:hypothetical protein DFH06DRAFT_1313956 [Mycena polygramma]|nr:hypothetical protein DFH06DRAFT_1313956 [Mycena polygramma]
MGSNQGSFSLIVSRYEDIFNSERPADQQRFFDTFIALLEQPKPSLCTLYFIGCLAPIEHAVTDGNSWASFITHNRTAIRLYQHKFLSTLASWLTQSRSQKECKNLWITPDAIKEADSQRCTEAGCNLADPFVARLHQIGSWHRGPYDPTSMARMAFQILAATLFSAAQEIKHTKTARRVRNIVSTTGLQQPWPMSMADVVGHSDVEGFSRQMEVWIGAWPAHSYPYCIFGSLANLYPHQFLTRIVSSKAIPFHIITTLRVIYERSRLKRKSGEHLLVELTSTLHLYEALLNELSRPLLLQFIDDGADDADEIPVVCSLLLQEIPCMLAREMPERLPGWLQGLADACTKTLLRLGSVVHAYLEMADDEPDRVALDSRILELSHAKRDRASGVITGAFEAFCSLAERQRCFAPGCKGTAATADLRKCSRCKRVLYCSTTCQREAWAHRVAPHKSLCVLITLLADHTGIFSQPQDSQLDSFYQSVDGNDEIEKVAKKFGESFQNLVRALGEGMSTSVV